MKKIKVRIKLVGAKKAQKELKMLAKMAGKLSKQIESVAKTGWEVRGSDGTVQRFDFIGTHNSKPSLRA